MSQIECVLVWDLEANCRCLNGEQNTLPSDQPVEIVEFPVCPFFTKSQSRIVEPFHSYVKPSVPITEACTSLTGITQNHVAQADDLMGVVENLDTWMKQHKFASEEGKLMNTIFACCGNYDPRALINEANRLGIQLPPYFYEPFMNIKVIYSDYLDSINAQPLQRNGKPKKRKDNEPFSNMGMTDVLETFGLTLEGRHHCGIDDAQNIKRIVGEMYKRGVPFRTTGVVDRNGVFKKMQ